MIELRPLSQETSTPSGELVSAEETKTREMLISHLFESKVETNFALPEQTLWAAVLLRAVLDWIMLYKGTKPLGTTLWYGEYSRGQLTQHLKQYFNDNESKPGSFEWICEHISDNPCALASKIRSLLTIDKSRIEKVAYRKISILGDGKSIKGSCLKQKTRAY